MDRSRLAGRRITQAFWPGCRHEQLGHCRLADDGWARWQPFFAYVLPTLSIFGVVVGALAAGWATPTECAALGAFATMLLALCYRAFSWDAVIKALKGTGQHDDDHAADLHAHRAGAGD